MTFLPRKFPRDSESAAGRPSTSEATTQLVLTMSECTTAAKYPLLSSVLKLARVNGDVIFGGNGNASTGRLKAVCTIQTPERYSSEGCKGRGSRDCYTVLTPPAEDEEQRDDDDHDDHHGHGERRPIADLAVLEGGQVGVVVQGGRGR